ncbi:PAS domain S-box protein [Halobellus ordinarius]|uniref:PAS domain S-box protein n=1 Tax=Halobellus ordinarius TaxID=3075120 RepID=UPI00288044CE|nr:PAS domain S-box protein [Halobellus sp. ZY16]
MDDQNGEDRTSTLSPAGVVNALQAVDELFYVFTADGEFQYWNDALSRETGYADATIAAMDPVDFFVAEDRELITDAIDRALDEAYARVEATLQTKDGDRLSYEFSAVSFTDDSTELLAGVGRDITERKQREEELLINEYTIESALSGIAIANLDGELISVNPSFLELWGYETEDEVLGKSVTEFWKRPEEAAKVASSVEETGQWNGELLAVRKDNTTFHAQCSASTVTDNEGEPLALMSSFVDITARKKRERELQKQTEQLEEFASVVSHDLRNPLNVAMGRLRLAQDEYDGDHLTHVETALERMEAIIEDTLVLAQQGQKVGESELVQIQQIAHRSWEMVDTSTATLEVSDGFGIYADQGRLMHLFENLYRNSIEHGSSNPRSDTHADDVEHATDGVTVQVGRLDDAGFYVEDDGPGIPEEERTKVLEAGHSQSSEGTGFGLAIVNRIADAHGWTLSITDSKEGGARFEFVNVDLCDPNRTVDEPSQN